MSLSPFRPFPAAALALLLAAACAKPEPPVAGRGALWEGPRAICDEYLFDTALANGQVATATIERADGLYDYLPPDTNLLGVRQRRFVIDLRPTVPQPGLPDIVWFHGGGGDAGMAANDLEEVFHFLDLGFRVWAVEYRRGWHGGTYDPCLPRDPFAATAEDLLRMPRAADLARVDARAAVAFIRSRTDRGLLLYGTSFGAALALGCGPFAESGFTAEQRVVGVAAAYGSVPADAELRNAVPTALWHGLDDRINGPDVGPLYGLEGPLAVIARGSRSIFAGIRDDMPAWLFLHPHGHGYGPDVTETRAADLLLGALLADAPSRGAYGVGPQGIIPLEE
jgi:hypothetical protein